MKKLTGKTSIINGVIWLFAFATNAMAQVLDLECKGQVYSKITPFEFGSLSLNYKGQPSQQGNIPVKMIVQFRKAEGQEHKVRIEGEGIGYFHFQNSNGTGAWGRWVDFGENDLWASQSCGGCWGMSSYQTLDLVINRTSGEITRMKVDTVISGGNPFDLIREVSLQENTILCRKITKAF